MDEALLLCLSDELKDYWHRRLEEELEFPITHVTETCKNIDPYYFKTMLVSINFVEKYGLGIPAIIKKHQPTITTYIVSHQHQDLSLDFFEDYLWMINHFHDPMDVRLIDERIENSKFNLSLTKTPIMIARFDQEQPIIIDMDIEFNDLDLDKLHEIIISIFMQEDKPNLFVKEFILGEYNRILVAQISKNTHYMIGFLISDTQGIQIPPKTERKHIIERFEHINYKRMKLNARTRRELIHALNG